MIETIMVTAFSIGVVLGFIHRTTTIAGRHKRLAATTEIVERSEVSINDIRAAKGLPPATEGEHK